MSTPLPCSPELADRLLQVLQRVAAAQERAADVLEGLAQRVDDGCDHLSDLVDAANGLVKAVEHIN